MKNTFSVFNVCNPADKPTNKQMDMSDLKQDVETIFLFTTLFIETVKCFNLVLMFQSSSRQEAHKMVHEANVKQAGAEKQLKEAQGKVCDVVSLKFCSPSGNTS